jgi:hypothetical protein
VLVAVMMNMGCRAGSWAVTEDQDSFAFQLGAVASVLAAPHVLMLLQLVVVLLQQKECLSECVDD